jgi:hypothetical protein
MDEANGGGRNTTGFQIELSVSGRDGRDGYDDDDE